MDYEKLRNQIGGIEVESDCMADNLAIVLHSYFEGHIERPYGDENLETDETGYTDWVKAKAEKALDLIISGIITFDRKGEI
jgi:hypothetical protein